MEALGEERIKQPETLQKIAYDKIKGLLTSGQMELDQVYSANKFAEILGVSRTPIREALLQLTSEGLLLSLGRRGFKVKEFTPKEIRDFFETRKLIEPFVIEQLCGKLSRQELEPLSDCLKVMDKDGEVDFTGFIEVDKFFHMTLIQRQGNLILASIMDNIRDLISILGMKALSKPGRVHAVIEEHRKIVQALLDNDKEGAVEAMLAHLNATEETIVNISRDRTS